MNKVNVSLDDLLPVIKEGLDNNQVVEIKVSGNSMYPFFKHQKTAIGLQRFNGTLTKNHIYFFEYNDKHILHRYLKTKDKTHYFKGDRLQQYEYPKKEQILAEVVYIKKNGKEQIPYTLFQTFKLYLSTIGNRIRNGILAIVRRKK